MNEPIDSSRTAETNRLLRMLFVAVALFGLIVAGGSYLFDATPDWRKPIVVLAGTGAFLVIWSLALRGRRGGKMQPHRHEGTEGRQDD